MSSNDRSQGTDSGPQAPYVLQELIKDVPLSGDEEEDTAEGAFITCVEFWSDNLYIGTSSGALLHHVSLPGSDESPSSPTLIQASKRSLPHTDSSSSADQNRAVKQILVLPQANKAFVLCQGLITIYSLPELTPTLTSFSARLTNCTWVGGLDLNKGADDRQDEEEDTIIICQKSRLRLVKVGDRLSQVREIGLGDCLAVARRGDIACIANQTSYSLLDVVEKRSIALFDILSRNDIESRSDELGDEGDKQSQQPSNQAVEGSNDEEEAQRSRDTSSRASPERPGRESPSPDAENSSESQGQQSLQPPLDDASFPPRQSSLTHSISPSRHDGAVNGSEVKTSSANGSRERHARPSSLQATALPLIISPSSDRVLLVTGTAPGDPGIGMFVNLDGDVVAPPLEFGSFPSSLCCQSNALSPEEGSNADGDFSNVDLFAVVKRQANGSQHRAVEIQKCSADANEAGNSRHWLALGPVQGHKLEAAGVRTTIDGFETIVQEVPRILASRQMQLKAEPKAESTMSIDPRSRENAEIQFIQRLSKVESRAVAWADNNLWLLAKHPQIVNTEAQLSRAMSVDPSGISLDRNFVGKVTQDCNNQEPGEELDFLSLTYVRQKTSLMLFVDLLSQAMQNIMIYEKDTVFTSEALAMGNVDPRIVLALIPLLREEVMEGSNGLWAQAGLQHTFHAAIKALPSSESLKTHGKSGIDVLKIVKGYLIHWRRKKGFGSVIDEKEVFASVDAALIRLLLILDNDSPRGTARKGSIRAEFNAVLDSGVDCFDRVVELLESFNRLYLMSRLYQSRKMSREVLATWRRIIDGETDAGGEFNGVVEVRRYLTVINDAKLVEEYGAWLAQKDPRLGVQVFADRNSKIKFEPKQAIKILQERAPAAVKVFLEHLVFESQMAAYANDLISYYLDSVLKELETSETASSRLLSSYDSYRKQRTPKPTYSQFADGLDIDADWWQNRLRLLQLLGGSQGAASKYDVSGILERVSQYEKELVPEMIILAGRQSQHNEAIRLLVHGLGDYDTAVTYCLRGGSSTYSPLSGSLPREATPSRQQQENLFRHLAQEFLRLDSEDDRLAQTSELLERFAPWFDPVEVVHMIPESWSVDQVCGFIETSLRHLITERNETAITKALLSSHNLNTNVQLIEKLEMIRPRIEEVAVDTV